MASVYDFVTDRIIAEMEKGEIPWKRPWSKLPIRGPFNWKTKRLYHGINYFILSPGEYATWNQITESGGKIINPKASYPVFFWKVVNGNSEDESENDSEENESYFIYRYYRVYDVVSNTENLQSNFHEEDIIMDENANIADAISVANSYIERENMVYKTGSNRAYYDPNSDAIVVPNYGQFEDKHTFFSTLFHELVHSTGSKSRLNRDLSGKFGSDSYSKEELVAELGSAMICARLGIDNDDLYENHSAYVQTWIKQFKNDPRLLSYAGSKAQKAADFILNV